VVLFVAFNALYKIDGRKLRWHDYSHQVWTKFFLWHRDIKEIMKKSPIDVCFNLFFFYFLLYYYLILLFKR